MNAAAVIAEKAEAAEIAETYAGDYARRNNYAKAWEYATAAVTAAAAARTEYELNGAALSRPDSYAAWNSFQQAARAAKRAVNAVY